MNNSMVKVRFKVDELINRSKVILVDQKGEGAISQAIFSVLHCYDRIATIRKRINSSLIKSRFKVGELINRSKVILLDQRGEGAISQAISILSAVVLGSLLLMGIYKLIESTVLFS
jgi:ribosome biogenesis SPOUT family RNA methylase Rps3